MSRKFSAINLFKYLDYREFLKDWYAYAKENKRGFSYRSFSKKAGFGSPNFLKRIMDGTRNLTEESLPDFMKALDLNKQEKDFFRTLVLFNQTESHDKKNSYYRHLLRSQKFSQLKPIEKDQYSYYSTWYHPVIRELIVKQDYDGTPEWLANNVRPPITPNEAKKSVELLERMGFIKKNGNGKWKQAESLVTTGPESASLVLLNYHQSVLDLVKDQLPQVPAENRDVSALTLGVVKDRLPQLKKKIQEFRQEILKLVSEDHQPDEVVLLSMQLLPVSQRESSENINKNTPSHKKKSGAQ